MLLVQLTHYNVNQFTTNITYMCIDIGTMYLNTKLLAPEYMRIHSTVAFKISHIVILCSLFTNPTLAQENMYGRFATIVVSCCCVRICTFKFLLQQMRYFVVHFWWKIWLCVCVCVCVHQQQNKFYSSNTRTGNM